MIFTECTSAQSRRPSTIARSLGINPKAHATSSAQSQQTDDFVCPEEFGYYSHPTDCSQYYVCVFGGALLESCTGGLMYSHELQTCDWPRNVGCEASDSGSPAVSGAERNGEEIKHRGKQSSLTRGDVSESVVSLYPVSRASIPPPPELKIAPKPVITSRGQPKPFEPVDIAKVNIIIFDLTN